MADRQLNSTLFSIPDSFLPDIELPVDTFWLKEDEILLKRDGKKVNAFIASPVGKDEESRKRMLNLIRICSVIKGLGARAYFLSSQPINKPGELGNAHSIMRISVTSVEPTEEAKRKAKVMYNNYLNKAKTAFAKYGSLQDDYFFLSLAFSYFYRSIIGRDYGSTKFIDAIVCFEALFNDGVGDIRYKIAMRAAFIIGITGLDSKKAFDEIGDLYNKRNYLLHGNENLAKPKNQHTPQDITNALRYARRCLIGFNILLGNRKKTIAIPNMKSHILDEIDHALLDSNKAKAITEEIQQALDDFDCNMPKEIKIIEFDTEPIQLT